jgi:transcriptional regulator with XRE-family HTH domain
VGVRIRIRRMMLGMTQTDIADRLGISFQQVQKYERGVDRVRVSRLHEFSNLLGVPVDYFFGGTPELDGPGGITDPVVCEFLASSDGLALAKSFSKLSGPDVRRSIVDLVHELSGPK